MASKETTSVSTYPDNQSEPTNTSSLASGSNPITTDPGNQNESTNTSTSSSSGSNPTTNVKKSGPKAYLRQYSAGPYTLSESILVASRPGYSVKLHD